ncbi:MAG: tetratricopeptide repeat protein [Steroidobacteraceae bacterium]
MHHATPLEKPRTRGMTLTAAQFARAAALEEAQLRVRRLQRMSDRELRALLEGDPAQAALWVNSAAEYGIAAAQLRLGRMLLGGRGVPRDERVALAWFIRAADQGSAEAMNMIGRCHENGWGVPIDLAAAAAHYRTSAARGHAWGEYNFANMLFDGRGIARDVPQALRWYLRAARRGHGRAMNLIGRCLEEGWGCRSSLSAAIEWYRRSAETGYFRGQLNYALALAENGLGACAAEWFCRAAEGGDEAIRRFIVCGLARSADPALAGVAARIAEMWRPQTSALNPSHAASERALRSPHR